MLCAQITGIQEMSDTLIRVHKWDESALDVGEDVCQK